VEENIIQGREMMNALIDDTYKYAYNDHPETAKLNGLLEVDRFIVSNPFGYDRVFLRFKNGGINNFNFTILDKDGNPRP
jgi:hypothetical protein